jgi:hypothetical protein
VSARETEGEGAGEGGAHGWSERAGERTTMRASKRATRLSLPARSLARSLAARSHGYRASPLNLPPCLSLSFRSLAAPPSAPTAASALSPWTCGARRRRAPTAATRMRRDSSLTRDRASVAKRAHAQTACARALKRAPVPASPRLDSTRADHTPTHTHNPLLTPRLSPIHSPRLRRTSSARCAARSAWRGSSMTATGRAPSRARRARRR